MPSTSSRLHEFRRGWRTLLGATIGISLGIAIVPAYTNGLVVNSLESEFGWSRGELSSLQLLASAVLIATAPLIGAMVDRWGVRIPGTVGMVALGLSYFVLSGALGDYTSFVVFFLIFAVMHILASPSTAVAFTRSVNRQFDHARGLALGISLSGVGLVAYLFPTLLGPLLADDWRRGFQVLGVIVLVGAAAVLLLMPRDLGGARSSRTARENRGAAPGSVTSHLIRQPLFARLAVAFFLLALGVGWIALFLVPMLRDAGTSAADAAQVAGFTGIAMLISRLVVGVLIDIYSATIVGAAVLVLAAGGLLALAVGGPSFGFAAAMAAGLALGAEVDLAGNMLSRYYPIEIYGRMFGIFYAVFTLGVGLSPVLANALHGIGQTYTVPLMVGVVLLLAASALFATAPRIPRAGEGRPVGDGASTALRTERLPD